MYKKIKNTNKSEDYKNIMTIKEEIYKYKNIDEYDKKIELAKSLLTHLNESVNKVNLMKEIDKTLYK